jgi:extracellular elastinolytic metalloproteinase
MKRNGLLAAITLAGILTPASAYGFAPRPKASPATVRTIAGHRVKLRAVPSPPRANLDTRAHARPVAHSAAVSVARSVLRASLGSTAIVEADPSTGGLRDVARLDGYLTGPSSDDPATVTLAYVREHLAAFGLTSSDLSALALVKRYTSPDGITHLLWAQTVGGVRVFDRDLRSAVTRDGRLLNVQGAPVHDASVPSSDPGVTPRNALADAQRSAGISLDVPPAKTSSGAQLLTRFQGGDNARLTVFPAAGADHLAWQVISQDPLRDVTYASLVDATSGKVLYRENLTSDLNAASVYDYYPGAPGNGGIQHTVDLSPWLDAPATTTVLAGNNAHVWEDVDDNGNIDANEEVFPSTATTPSQWSYTQKSFQTLTPTGTNPDASAYDPKCPSAGCTWNPFAALGDTQSWTANSDENGAQLFYFVNKAHDYFAQPPVGFTAAARGFEGTDRLLVRGLAGAINQGGGSLDTTHLNNANMTTLPDGQSPFMRMYLFANLGQGGEERVVNGGDDASVVYHEYQHAITGRTIVDASGMQALTPKQAGGMNEGWSDWFANDFIFAQGLATDNPASPGDVLIGGYESKVPIGKGFRTQPLDCPPNGGGAVCPGTPTAGPGGYTYADMGQIQGRDTAEVHADGELWAETLWDVRTKVGHDNALAIISGGQKLTPPNPSMLDARNAILQSALTVGGLSLQYQAWLAFAGRGMGVNARTVNADDIHPTEDFTGPPAPVTCFNGTVVAAGTACPVPPPPPNPKPVLSSVSASPSTFRLGTALAKLAAKAKVKKVPTGTTISFKVSKPASIKLTFGRATSGRKVGRSCLTATKARAKKAKCTRYVSRGTLTVSAKLGTHKLRFQGRLSHAKTLPTGSYHVTLVASDSAKQLSAAKRITLKILSKLR